MEKLCIFCVHGGFTDGGYGEYADPAAFECGKGLLPKTEHGHGGSERFVFDIQDWRDIIVTAQTCPSYKQVKA